MHVREQAADSSSISSRETQGRKRPPLHDSHPSPPTPAREPRDPSMPALRRLPFIATNQLEGKCLSSYANCQHFFSSRVFTNNSTRNDLLRYRFRHIELRRRRSSRRNDASRIG